jgi:hypothetical protein
MLRAIFNRLKEPSTMAGLSMLAALFGAKPDTVSAIADATVALVTAGAAPNPATVLSAVTALCAAAAVLVPEHKPALLVVKPEAAK